MMCTRSWTHISISRPILMASRHHIHDRLFISSRDSRSEDEPLYFTTQFLTKSTFVDDVDSWAY